MWENNNNNKKSQTPLASAILYVPLSKVTIFISLNPPHMLALTATVCGVHQTESLTVLTCCKLMLQNLALNSLLFQNICSHIQWGSLNIYIYILNYKFSFPLSVLFPSSYMSGVRKVDEYIVTIVSSIKYLFILFQRNV